MLSPKEMISSEIDLPLFHKRTGFFTIGNFNAACAAEITGTEQVHGNSNRAENAQGFQAQDFMFWPIAKAWRVCIIAREKGRVKPCALRRVQWDDVYYVVESKDKRLPTPEANMASSLSSNLYYGHILKATQDL